MIGTREFQPRTMYRPDRGQIRTDTMRIIHRANGQAV